MALEGKTISNKLSESAALVLVACLCFPAICAAEVMDKEPSFISVWAWAILSSLVGLFATKYRWWLMFLSLPLPLMFYYRMIFLELANEYVYAAIKVEAGEFYIYSIYIGFALVLLSNISGTIWGMREKQKENQLAL